MKDSITVNVSEGLGIDYHYISNQLDGYDYGEIRALEDEKSDLLNMLLYMLCADYYRDHPNLADCTCNTCSLIQEGMKKIEECDGELPLS